MLNLYIGERNENFTHIPILDFYWGERDKKNKLYSNTAEKTFIKKFFNIADTPEMADAILVPYEYFEIVKDHRYMENIHLIAKKSNKKVIFYDSSDYSGRVIREPNSVILRVSSYRDGRNNGNVIIMPYYTEDLGEKYGCTNIKWEKFPTIGFCGWAAFSSTKSRVKAYLKNIGPLFMGLFVSKIHFSKIQGVLLRKYVLGKIVKSKLFKTNFILRRSFSSHLKTIEVDPVVARDEYVSNIKQSHLSLAIKGDANASVRFYEILSLGSIPLLVDTNCVLPLEDIIDYNSFTLRVPVGAIGNVEQGISNVWRILTESRYYDMQKGARESYEKYLRPDSFFTFIFEGSYIKKNL